MENNDKKLRLMESISNIDGKYISEAAEENADSTKAARPWYKKTAVLSSAAACICVIAAAGIIAGTAGKPPYPVRQIIVSNTSQENDAAYIPKWNELSIDEQYTELTLNGRTYNTNCHRLNEAKKADRHISDSTVSGVDVYTEKTYTAKTQIYTISGISQDYAVTAKLPDGKYYVYTDAGNYSPESLEVFVNDLSLFENAEFGTIYSDYTVGENNTRELHIDGLTTDIVRDMLFSDGSAPLVTDRSIEEEMNDRKVISFAVSVPLLGINNLSIWLTEDGYLCTNLLTDNKCFYIGKDKVNEFCDYAKKNLDAYIVEYIYSEYPENNNGNSGNGESYIVHYDPISGVEWTEKA